MRLDTLRIKKPHMFKRGPYWYVTQGFYTARGATVRVALANFRELLFFRKLKI